MADLRCDHHRSYRNRVLVRIQNHNAMNATDIIMIGLVAGFVVFCLICAAAMVAIMLDNDDEFEDLDVRIPETFELPKRLIELDEEEKRRCNQCNAH